MFQRERTHGCLDILHRTVRMSLRSGSLPSVKMMQAAHFWNFDHVAQRGRLDGSADRRILFKRQMCPAALVVFEIVFQDSTQAGLMEDDDVVQTFATN